MRKIVCFESRREERLGFVLEILALDGEVVLNQRWGWRTKREYDFRFGVSQFSYGCSFATKGGVLTQALSPFV